VSSGRQGKGAGTGDPAAAGRPDEALLRALAPSVLAAVARRHGRFDLAEDATQEALIAAAEQWPAEGVPGNPRGWLIAVASRRLVDALRAEAARERRERTFAATHGRRASRPQRPSRQ